MTKTLEDGLPSFEEAPLDPTVFLPTAPIDETSSRYNNKQYDENIGLTDHEIIVLDSKYVTPRHTVFCFKRELDYFHDNHNNSLTIYDNENRQVFTCKENKNYVELYDHFNDALLSIRVDPFGNNKSFYIYDVREEEVKRLVSVKKNSKKGLNVEFVNKISGEKEELEIRINDAGKISYDIYCNVGQENETLISKITKRNGIFTIEIGPGIDYTLILGICTYFLKMYERNKNKKQDIAGVALFMCTIQ